MLLEKLQKHWNELIRNVCINTDITDAVFVELTAQYSQSHRHYHTLTHVLQVLESLETQANQLVHYAAWFHDAIYDPQAKDNEEQSAELARSRLVWLSESELARISDFILCTKTHQATDPEAQMLLDADLAILDAEATQYWDYAKAIRQEYAWVPDQGYRVGRRAVLEEFLEQWEQGKLYFSAIPRRRVGMNLRQEMEVLRTAAKIF
jgi:predicted metal-dependent HD superfamily phosphohydrolase